jgi:hypothetical protein
VAGKFSFVKQEGYVEYLNAIGMYFFYFFAFLFHMSLIKMTLTIKSEIGVAAANW